METPFCTIAPQYPGEVGKPGKSSTWVLDGDGIKADVDLDFVNNRGWQGRIASLASLVTCTRSISGTGHVYDYADDVNGVWYPFLANVPRITNKGLLVEEQRTNSLRTANPYETASPLTYGAAATDDVELLTNWNFASDLSTGWTVTNAGGSSFARVGTNNVTLTYDGTNATYLDQSFPTVVGQRYTVRVAYASITSLSPRLDVGTSQGGTQFFSATSLSTGPAYRTFIATTTTTWIRLKAATSSGSAQLYSVSVKSGGYPSIGTTATWSVVDGDVDDNEIYLRVTGVGVASNGLPYIRVKIAGTSGAGSGSISFRFETSAQIAANNSTLAVWSGGVMTKLVNGSTSGFSSITYQINPTNGSSTLSGGQYSGSLTIGSAFVTHTGSTNFTNASTTNVYSAVAYTWSGSQTLDLEMDIICLNLELGPFMTSPILTTTSAVTRNADAVQMTLPTIGSEYSMYTNAISPPAWATGTSANFYGSLNNGSFNNRFTIGYYASDTVFRASSTSTGGGSSSGNVSLATPSLSSEFKAALSLSLNNLMAAENGVAGSPDTVVDLPVGFTRFDIGSSAGSFFINNYIKRIALWNTKQISQSELNRLTA